MSNNNDFSDVASVARCLINAYVAVSSEARCLIITTFLTSPVWLDV